MDELWTETRPESAKKILREGSEVLLSYLDQTEQCEGRASGRRVPKKRQSRNRSRKMDMSAVLDGPDVEDRKMDENMRFNAAHSGS